MISNLILIAYAISTSLALVLLKLGSQAGAIVSIIDSKVIFNPSLLNLGGVLFYGISFVIYTYLIAKYDLGFIIPLATAMVYILIFIASFIIFKESFSMIKIVAIGLILTGIVLLNMSKS